MQPSDFNKNAPGKLIKNLSGHWTFLPDPLPPKIDWNAGLAGTVAEAERGLGRLAGLGHRFPNPQRLVRMFLKREAELSSRIENTMASVRTQLLFEYLPEIEQGAPDVREVANNFDALDYGLRTAANRPLSLGLIKELHQLLLRGVREHDMTPGAFRMEQVYIGSARGIERATYVPPPAHEVDQCMRSLEAYMRKPDGNPTLIRAAVAHYQFEAIHPFLDGNGRIGRVLILLMLCREGSLHIPLLNPSAPLERNRREYYDCLKAVSHRGRWSEWIEFFVRGVVEEAEDAIRRVETLDRLREEYQRRIRTRRASALLPRLVDELFGQPTLTLKSVMRLMEIKAPSAQKLIDKLVDAGVIKEVTGKQRNRVYIANEIVGVFAAAS